MVRPASGNRKPHQFSSELQCSGVARGGSPAPRVVGRQPHAYGNFVGAGVGTGSQYSRGTTRALGRVVTATFPTRAGGGKEFMATSRGSGGG
eukprot:gene23095-biopygen2815